MGPQEAKEFFTEHLEERRRLYDDRKLTPGGEGFMDLYYPNPFDPLERRKSNMEKDNIYAEMEWFAGGGGDPAKYEKSEIEIPVVEKKEERTMVIQTCENCMYKGVCKHQEIFENICKNENLFGGVEVYLGENRYGPLRNLDFIELCRPTCKYFLMKNYTGIR